MWRRRVVTILVVASVIVGFVVTLNQPWLEQWGATAAERAETFPGDDIVADASAVYTRSVSIDAPPGEVWPWLVQMGQDKAGFYSFDWAETLFTDPMRNATMIHPEWQQLEVGDLVHPFPPERGLPSWRVRQLEPARFLLLALDDDSWSLAFDLRATPGGRTRLVTRFRSEPNWMNVALGPADLIVFPRLLVGVQQRAEGTMPGMPGVSTGAPLPTARLPVHGWAAALWLAGLAALGSLGGRRLRVAGWGQSRPHPGITIGIAFVIGAGYAIMSDTPPTQFLVRGWAFGLPLAIVVAAVAGRGFGGSSTSWLRRTGRSVVAVAETGMFVVLPATVVWHAATAQGWTDGVAGPAVTSVAAVAAAVLIATISVEADCLRSRRVLTLGAMAFCYVISGSALVPLLGAPLLELTPASVPAGSGEPGGLTSSVDDRSPVPA